MGDLWDLWSLGSQPADKGSSLQSQKFLLAAGMYTAMSSDADTILSNKNYNLALNS